MNIYDRRWPHSDGDHVLRRLVDRIIIGLEVLGIAAVVLALLIVPLAMVIVLPLSRVLIYRLS